MASATSIDCRLVGINLSARFLQPIPTQSTHVRGGHGTWALTQQHTAPPCCASARTTRCAAQRVLAPHAPRLCSGSADGRRAGNEWLANCQAQREKAAAHWRWRYRRLCRHAKTPKPPIALHVEHAHTNTQAARWMVLHCLSASRPSWKRTQVCHSSTVCIDPLGTWHAASGNVWMCAACVDRHSCVRTYQPKCIAVLYQ